MPKTVYTGKQSRIYMDLDQFQQENSKMAKTQSEQTWILRFCHYHLFYECFVTTLLKIWCTWKESEVYICLYACLNGFLMLYGHLLQAA